MSRGLTGIYTDLAAHNLCKALGHAESLRGGESWACSTCRADIVRLVDAPRLAEVATAKQFSGTWNNWIAPFHRCASCGDSLNWQQSVDVFDRPLITASCACGVMYSARLGEEGIEQARAVDAGNKLAALCVAPAAPVDLSAVEVAIDDYGRVCWRHGSHRTQAAQDHATALLSLYRTAVSGVPAKEAGETTAMRRFTVYRRGDLSATHNDQQAAPPDQPQYEGVVFTDGRVALRWLTPLRSTSCWDSLDDALGVHGHPEPRYGTELVWHDPTTPSPEDRK